MNVLRILFFIILSLVSLRSYALENGEVISDILVRGNKRVTRESILSSMSLKPGEAYSDGYVAKDIKTLYATGSFAKVNVSSVDKNVIVDIVENPSITVVAFEGNKAIDDEALAKEVGINPRDIFSKFKVQRANKRILSIYRSLGYFNAKVEPKVILLPQDRVNLVFEIQEGKKVTVGLINFTGNKKYSSSKLKDIMATKEKKWYRFFGASDTYDPDKSEYDRELLRRYYNERGYYDFKVNNITSEYDVASNQFFLNYDVSEGEIYKVGKISFDLNFGKFTNKELLSYIDFKVGSVYNSKLVSDSITSLIKRVNNLGYSFVEFEPVITKIGKNLLNITFVGKEGQRIFVERIDIYGNTRTEDKVIRREFRFVEGDSLIADNLRRSRERIGSLGYFGGVDVKVEDGSTPTSKVVSVGVTEKSTGSLNLALGYSTDTQINFDASIVEKNFLGKGLEIGAKLAINKDQLQVDVDYFDASFLDKDFGLGVNVYNIVQSDSFKDDNLYGQMETGAKVRLAYPITERISQSWTYELERTHIYDVNNLASQYVKDTAGVTWLSSIETSFVYDGLNNRLNPTDGVIGSFDIQYAGIGGDVSFIKFSAKASYFKTIAESFTFGIKFRGGYLIPQKGIIPIGDRFTLGSRELRGFEIETIGPFDPSNDTSLGGDWMYGFNAELDFPLGFPKEYDVKGMIFLDAVSIGGAPSNAQSYTINSSSLRASVGIGVLWRSPMGPIFLGYAQPLLYEKYDKFEKFFFTIGTTF